MYDNNLVITNPEALLKEGHDKLTVVSKYESVDYNVANFETPLSHHHKQHHSALNITTTSVDSNGVLVEGSRYDLNVNTTVKGDKLENVEGSRYDLNFNAAAEGKEPKNVNSNLDDVNAIAIADATTDAIDHAKFIVIL